MKHFMSVSIIVLLFVSSASAQSTRLAEYSAPQDANVVISTGEPKEVQGDYRITPWLLAVDSMYFGQGDAVEETEVTPGMHTIKVFFATDYKRDGQAGFVDANLPKHQDHGAKELPYIQHEFEPNAVYELQYEVRGMEETRGDRVSNIGDLLDALSGAKEVGPKVAIKLENVRFSLVSRKNAPVSKPNAYSSRRRARRRVTLSPCEESCLELYKSGELRRGVTIDECFNLICE